MLGELVPVGGGDPIPLVKERLKVGRRESCDIVLRFSNISAHHCELLLDSGYWYVRDLNSSNGTKVNGVRVLERRIDPGAILSLAKHAYRVEYDPEALGASGPPPPATIPEDILRTSLLERAGLVQKKPADRRRRYDVTNDGPGQIKNPYDPV